MRWLRWEDASEAILELRRKVYVEEQGIAGDIVTHPRDPSGLHLAAAVDGVLVACVSIWVFEAGAPELATWALAPIDGLTVQFGKRLELRSHRGHGITEVLVAGLLRYVYESLRPGRLFIVLRDVHRSLQPHYARLFNAEFHAEVQVDGEAMIVMTAEGEAKLRAQYLKAREMAEGALRRCPVVVPSLVRFLADEGRAGLFLLRVAGKAVALSCALPWQPCRARRHCWRTGSSRVRPRCAQGRRAIPGSAPRRAPSAPRAR